MDADMKVSGSITTWKAWVSTSGTMAESIKASIKMIRNMGLESILGLIRGATKDIGIKENNMD